jgi:4-hydroxy-3-methylbut-2-en-1-yl diphosphate reductase
VRCPAAPVLAAALARAGRRVREAPVVLRPGSRQATDAVAFVVSYLDPKGHAVGLAAVAHRDDVAGLAVADAAVREWSAVPRTRRVLLTDVDPYCRGARRALDMVEYALRMGHGRVYVVGQPAFGSQVLASLEHRGVVLVDDLDQVPDEATVVFPAHGVTLRVRAEVAARGLRVVDATCPLVSGGHAEIRRFADRGDTVVLIGHPSHAAVAPFAGQAAEQVVIVHDVGDVEALGIPDSSRLSYIVEPGMVVEDAAEVVAALRRRYPKARGAHPDRWCYAASDRAETVRAVATACDVTLVLGTAGTGDVRNLAELARANGTTVHTIAEVGDLRPGMLAEATTVGLVSSISTPPGLGDDVVEVLSGLGPLSVVRRRVSSDVVAVAPFPPAGTSCAEQVAVSK